MGRHSVPDPDDPSGERPYPGDDYDDYSDDYQTTRFTRRTRPPRHQTGSRVRRPDRARVTAHGASGHGPGRYGRPEVPGRWVRDPAPGPVTRPPGTTPDYDAGYDDAGYDDAGYDGIRRGSGLPRIRLLVARRRPRLRGARTGHPVVRDVDPATPLARRPARSTAASGRAAIGPAATARSLPDGVVSAKASSARSPRSSWSSARSSSGASSVTRLSSRSEAAAARCVSGDVAVAVIADPSIADQVRTFADQYNKTATPVGDKCVKVGVKSAGSDQVIDGLSGKWPAELGEQPALWIPAVPCRPPGWKRPPTRRPSPPAARWSAHPSCSPCVRN